jgi:hypothetical protein
MFPTKYPLMMAAMNGGSEIKLAIACQRAGIMPSLYITEQEKRIKNFKFFCDVTGTNHVIMAISELEIVKNLYAIEELVIAGARYFEVIGFVPSEEANTPVWSTSTKPIEQQKEIWRNTFESNISLFDVCHWQMRTNVPLNEIKLFVPCLKGNDSAGLSFGTEYTTKKLFDEQKKITPDVLTIPYGGVGTAQDVKYYVDRGVFSVAVGTRLALSEESPLSKETKLKIIEKQDQRTRLPDTQQNAVILGDRETVMQPAKNQNEDWNRSNSLKQGIHGDGTSGHVYVGEGLKNIKKIQPVDAIISDLTSFL